ncbi:MAG TPA: UDP-2,4-diacetamido-2,4,6-trideoxy-beta-L-altropyranose hydrolase [Rhodocyclaceae bacterium]
MSGLVAFRADASRTLGHGHVMRCLALADVLRDRGRRCLFIAAADGTALHGEAAARGHLTATLPTLVDEVADGAASAALARDAGSLQAMVMDHYGLGPAWQASARLGGGPLLVIDDAPRRHDCDGLLDQNVVDPGNPYAGHVPAACQCFLGPRYALLRPEFSRLREACPVRRELRRILIFFGGSDPTDETGKALAGVCRAGGDWQVDVVVGSSYPHREALASQVAETPERLHLHVQTPHMAELMAAADLAIGAGGSASWERCCLRLPAIVSVLADNQAPIAERLQRLDAAVNLGTAVALGANDYAAAINALTPAKLARLSENSALLADGLGAPRLADALEQLIRSKQQ